MEASARRTPRIGGTPRSTHTSYRTYSPASASKASGTARCSAASSPRAGPAGANRVPTYVWTARRMQARRNGVRTAARTASARGLFRSAPHTPESAPPAPGSGPVIFSSSWIGRLVTSTKIINYFLGTKFTRPTPTKTRRLATTLRAVRWSRPRISAMTIAMTGWT